MTSSSDTHSPAREPYTYYVGLYYEALNNQRAADCAWPPRSLARAAYVWVRAPHCRCRVVAWFKTRSQPLLPWGHVPLSVIVHLAKGLGGVAQAVGLAPLLDHGHVVDRHGEATGEGPATGQGPLATYPRTWRRCVSQAKFPGLFCCVAQSRR
jgi:hypothetical protein